jgi:putative transposase
VGYLQAAYSLSQRRACHLVRAHRSTVRYQRRVREHEEQIRERVRTLAGERPRWGYRRLPILLRREYPELAPINRKRVYRLYRLDGLAIRRRKRQRVALPPRGIQTTSTWQRGEVWAMDFLPDVLADGRRFRLLNILDPVTRACLATLGRYLVAWTARGAQPGAARRALWPSQTASRG